VAGITRACTYDRAGLGYSGPGRKPRTSDRMALELHALLVAAQVPPPYVLVGHSAGGLNVRLFAEDHRDEVAGMVLVDATTAGGERLWASLGEQERQQLRERMQRGPDGWDYDSFLTSMRQVGKAAGLGDLPLVVLTAGHAEPAQPGVTPEQAAQRFELWKELQAELPGLSSNAQHVVVADARHFIQWDTPAVVFRAVRDVVQAARTGQRLAGAAPVDPSAAQAATAKPSAAAPPEPHAASEPRVPLPAEARPRASLATPGNTSTATLWERWQQGGLVMYPLLVLSALALATLLEHLLGSRRQRAHEQALFQRADELWSAGQFTELEQLCQQDQGAGASALLAIVRYRRQPYADVNTVAGEIASAALRDQLRRALWLGVAATLSPLLGLFGTVIGMVEAFDAVAASGTMGDAGLVASGISKALITTAAGLMIGIPALGARHFVLARIHRAAATLEGQLNERLRRWLLSGGAS
jgi:biopolymer transport protein ExbB